jgi:glycosyltransferase involved in cell wall biosynthesis
MHLLGAIAKPSSAALVWHFHDYPSGRPLTGRLVRALSHQCDAIIAVSDSVAVDIRTVVDKHIDLRTIGNSVDLVRFGRSGPRLDLDALSGLPRTPPVVPRIGLVATFARWKGHVLFLDMMKALSATESVRGYVVGGPVYETQASQISMDELRAAVAERGLTEIVGLTGFVSDSAAALRSLDIVVHASTAREPFGLVIAEAMAAGRAVVTSDVGGIAEFVSDERTGLTYAAGSVTDMTRQVRRLVRDDALRQQLGQAAESAAGFRFDPALLCTQVLDLYTRFDRPLAA